MGELKLVAENERKTALVIDQHDNVAIALTDLKKGDICIVRREANEEKIEVIDDVDFGHKFALVDLSKDETVLKYGEEIGKMSESVLRGGWIHSHNMYCERGLKHGR